MISILNQISNLLGNTSDPVPDSSQDSGAIAMTAAGAVISLTLSLSFVLLACVLAVFLKQWLWIRKRNPVTSHNPKEQAINLELYAQCLRRWAIIILFELLPWLMQLSVWSFYFGAMLTMTSLELGPYLFSTILVSLLIFGCTAGTVTLHQAAYILSVIGRLTWNVVQKRISRSSSHGAVLDHEIVYVGISNRLLTHIAMVQNNFHIYIFTQLFSLPVEHPQIRIKFIAPWYQLSSLLSSMLVETCSKSRCNHLPVLRLCLVVSGQGQTERLRANREVKRLYSATKTSNPLQNLYLNLLLSQHHATSGDADHWQEACRILRGLEYSEEHTSEIVWLVDSIQLYTLWIKVDFVVDFLRGVVVYLSKCPSDEHNADLLPTATIVAAEWLVSRQSCHYVILPLRYILSSQDVYFGEWSHKVFVLVKNQRLSLADRVQHTIKLYQDSYEIDSSSGFVIRTLLIPIMVIEGLAVENNNGENISDAVPRIQSDDLRCALEGLWDLWEGGFNQSDLLRFIFLSVVPPSPSVGNSQSSMVIPLLKEYLQQVDESPALITEKAFRFIDAALEHLVTTGTTRDELELQLQDGQSTNPWLALHIDNILHRRSTPSVADLEAVTTLDSNIKAMVIRKRFNLYLSLNVQPEPDILTLLVQSDDHVISLEAFGQGVNLLESPPTDEPGGRDPGSPGPFTFALLDEEKRSYIISHLFDPNQPTSMRQNVWIMLTEDLYPRWELLPAEWRRDMATALVETTEWMEKGQGVLAEAIKKRRRIRASGKVKQLIGATALALVNGSDAKPHQERKVPLEARDEGFQERLEACAQVYLPLFATAVEQLGESAKPRTRHIVAFLVGIPDALYNEDAIRRIQHALGI